MTAGGAPIRWGLLGAARIAEQSFLPALREVGGGRAALVGARDAGRAERWAAGHGVERAVAGYEAVVESPDVDAVYVALPNTAHGEWTRRALLAGKAVLCEKPLCADVTETAAVLETAAAAAAPLWEAFVFLFGAQHRRLRDLLAAGAIGELGEINSVLFFVLDHAGDFRLTAALGGGALGDLGCYPVRFAQELFPVTTPPAVTATGTVEGSVESEASAVIRYATGRLVMSCGFHLAQTAVMDLLGTEGQIRLTNAFHPGPSDTVSVLRPGRDPVVERPTPDTHPFTPALRHIHAVLREEAAPEHLAVNGSLPTAELLATLQTAVRR
jgi:predicted dehydrogenase